MARKPRMTRMLNVRITERRGQALDELGRKSGLTESQLVRYAIWRLPRAASMTGDDLADLRVSVLGDVEGNE